MRIAVIADVHGNARALRAVLADVDRQSPDVVVNLGDCFSGPLDVEATADLLLERECVTVRGNCDREIIDRPLSEMGASDRAAATRLRPEARAWLSDLPSIEIVDDVLLCHGTPHDDSLYLAEEVGVNGVHLAPPNTISGRVGGRTESVILCGHSHVPRVVAIDGNRLVVNPGSVGLPAYETDGPYPHTMEAGSPHARYAMMDRNHGQWSVTLHCIEYDWRAAATLARNAGREDWAYALLTGYAPPVRSHG